MCIFVRLDTYNELYFHVQFLYVIVSIKTSHMTVENLCDWCNTPAVFNINMLSISSLNNIGQC